MKIEQKKKTIQKKTILKPARYEEEKTGEKRTIEIQKTDGTFVQEEREITRRVFKDVEYRIDDEQITVWIVDDGVDKHEFSNQEDAKKFVGGK